MPIDTLFTFKNVGALERKFGKENVVEGRLGIDPATFLFPKTKHEVIIGWMDQKTRSGGIGWLMVQKDRAAIFWNGGNEHFPISRWETKEHLYLGMTLKDLEKKNRKPFKFLLDHGTVIDWNDGALATIEYFVRLDTKSASGVAEMSSDHPCGTRKQS